MHVRMTVGGQSEQQLLASLENWLQLEPDLKNVPVRREPARGPAGRTQLTIALPDRGTPSVLAEALSTWVSTRIGDVRLQVTGPQASVEVSVSNIADHDELLREALGEDRWPASSREKHAQEQL